MKQATGNYGLLIKTDQYAGNFEREMAAYCTGIVGEDDDTGSDYVEELELNFEDIVEQIPDDNGTYRPVSLDDNDANNFIIWFETEPTIDHVRLVAERATKFSEVRANHPKWGEFYKKSDPIVILSVEQI